MNLSSSIPRYAVVPHARTPLSAREVLLVTRSGERHVMTLDVLEALDGMTRFATLDAHRQDLVQRKPELARAGDQVLRVLESLVQRGLLRSEDSVRQALRTAPAGTPGPLTVVVQLTGRDPLPLLRALNTALAGIPLRAVHLLIPSGVQVDAAAITSVAGALPLRLQPMDALQEWLHGLGESQRTGGGPLASSLALAPANLAQLLGAGGPVLWLEDRHHLPLHQPGVGLQPSRHDEDTRRAVHWHSDHHAALAAGIPAGAALLDALQACGQTLAGLPADLHPATLEGMSPEMLEVLRGDSRVRAVVCGTRGCAEGPHSLWLYLLSAAERERWCSSRSEYERGLEAEALTHVVPGPRLQRGGAYRPLLLDASHVGGLVPASTLHADRVLHALGSYADPHSLVLQLPLTLGYSVRLGASRASANRQVIAPSVNGFVADLALQSRDDVRSSDAGRRLLRLAATLRDQADATVHDRKALLWEYVAWQQSQTIAALQDAIESAGAEAPDYWHQDLASIVQGYGQALLGARVARLAETPDHLDSVQAADHCAELLQAVADRLELWPGLLHAAQG